MAKDITLSKIYGTCYKSGNNEFLKIDVLNKLDIQRMLLFKPDIIIWSIMDIENEMLFSQIGLNEIVNNISKDIRFIYVSTTVGKGRYQTENVIVQDLANAIIELAHDNFTGTINISAEKPVSHYVFNKYLASIRNIDNSFIVPDYKEEEVYHNLDNCRRRLMLNTIIQDI
jgi:hypothetical protein